MTKISKKSILKYPQASRLQGKQGSAVSLVTFNTPLFLFQRVDAFKRSPVIYPITAMLTHASHMNVNKKISKTQYP